MNERTVLIPAFLPLKASVPNLRRRMHWAFIQRNNRDCATLLFRDFQPRSFSNQKTPLLSLKSRIAIRKMKFNRCPRVALVTTICPPGTSTVPVWDRSERGSANESKAVATARNLRSNIAHTRDERSRRLFCICRIVYQKNLLMSQSRGRFWRGG